MNETNDLLVEQSDQTDNIIPTPTPAADPLLDTPTVYVINDTYAGTISDTYLDYFRGIAEKLPYDQHYVVWRTGSNSYSMAYGENINVNGYYFTGEDLWITTIYRDGDNYMSNWYVHHDVDEIAIDAFDIFVYSDLGETFPDLRQGGGNIEMYALLFAVAFLFAFIVLRDIFNSIRY